MRGSAPSVVAGGLSFGRALLWPPVDSTLPYDLGYDGGPHFSSFTRDFFGLWLNFDAVLIYVALLHFIVYDFHVAAFDDF